MTYAERDEVILSLSGRGDEFVCDFVHYSE